MLGFSDSARPSQTLNCAVKEQVGVRVRVRARARSGRGEGRRLLPRSR